MKTLKHLLLLLIPVVVSCSVNNGDNNNYHDPYEEKDDRITVIAQIADTNPVFVDSGDDASEFSQKNLWKTGDCIQVVYGDDLYAYRTYTPGKLSLFHPDDDQKSIQSLDNGSLVSAWYNVQLASASDNQSFSFIADQFEGEFSNKIPFSADYMVQEDNETELYFVFTPKVSILEFRLSSSSDFLVDKVTLTPSEQEDSPLSLTLSGSYNIAGGRNIHFLVDKVKYASGVTLDLFYDDNKVFSEVLWQESTLDMTSVIKHYYHAVDVTKANEGDDPEGDDNDQPESGDDSQPDSGDNHPGAGDDDPSDFKNLPFMKYDEQ